MPSDRVQQLLNAELRAVLARRGCSHTEASADLGVAQTTLSGRLRGSTDWRFVDLWEFSERFGVPLSRLVAAVEAEVQAERERISA